MGAATQIIAAAAGGIRAEEVALSVAAADCSKIMVWDFIGFLDSSAPFQNGKNQKKYRPFVSSSRYNTTYRTLRICWEHTAHAASREIWPNRLPHLATTYKQLLFALFGVTIEEHGPEIS